MSVSHSFVMRDLVDVESSGNENSRCVGLGEAGGTHRDLMFSTRSGNRIMDVEVEQKEASAQCSAPHDNSIVQQYELHRCDCAHY